MNAIKMIFNEHKENIYLIARLSGYEQKTSYISNRLGLVWMILNPLFQIGVYWVVFGLGIRGGASVDGVPFFIWLICGLIPWFYIGAGITKGSNSIYTRLSLVSKMNFPLSIIPTYVIISELYSHLILLVVLIVAVYISHGLTVISIFGLFYFGFAATCFLIGLSLITSTLSTLVRDIQLVVQSVNRMLFFLTPVMWTLNSSTPVILKNIIEINPFYYIIKGYRASLLWGDLSIIGSWYTLYFWITILVMFIVGSMIHVRFRKFFVDYV